MTGDHEGDCLLFGQIKTRERKIRFFTFISVQIYSGITSGRILDGELLYTKILEEARSAP